MIPHCTFTLPRIACFYNRQEVKSQVHRCMLHWLFHIKSLAYTFVGYTVQYYVFQRDYNVFQRLYQIVRPYMFYTDVWLAQGRIRSTVIRL